MDWMTAAGTLGLLVGVWGVLMAAHSLWRARGQRRTGARQPAFQERVRAYFQKHGRRKLEENERLRRRTGSTFSERIHGR